MRTLSSVLIVSAALLASSRVEAQVIGVQAVHVPGRDGRRASIGLQGELGVILSTWRLGLWPSVAIEYQREGGEGPGRGRLAAELRILPTLGESGLHPYAGGGVSANQSGGVRSEWSGTLLGLQAIAGIMLVPSERVPIAFILEERFGYVRGHNHATATHLGVALSLH